MLPDAKHLTDAIQWLDVLTGLIEAVSLYTQEQLTDMGGQ
jgi:hypothetical protein